MPSVSRRYASAARAFERPGSLREAPGPAPVVLMVSGGADSTALLVLAATAELDIDDGRGPARIARERLHVLHVNHALRGQDADDDERFVRALADELGIPCVVVRRDIAAMAAQGPDSNVENVAREVRYEAATRLANELCAQAGLPRSSARILTAHTANDRAETFFMNAIKGSGAQGLSSIPRRRNRVVRPLLDRTHEELCELLRVRGIEWREDSTNADTRYLRSFVRHQIVPLALRRNPRLMENLSATCDILSDEDAYLTQLATRALLNLERRRAQGLEVLDAARLAATEVALARRIVRLAVARAMPECRLDARHVARVLGCVAAREGSLTLPLGVDVRVAHGALFVRARTAEPAACPGGWLEVPGLAGAAGMSRELAAPGGTGELALPGPRVLAAHLREVGAHARPVSLAAAQAREWDGASVLLDAAACGLGPLGGRLWVDAPQAGDVLCPLGMHGQSKKLSDLLADEHVPAAERASVPIVRTDPTGAIVWVAGIRPDERARVTQASRVLLELRIRQGA